MILDPELLIDVLLAVLVLFGVLAIYRARRGRQPYQRPPRKRGVQRTADGRISTVLGRTARGPVTLDGEGATESNPVVLEAGRYKVAYRFPERVLTSVRLVSTATGDDEVVLVEAGSGEIAFRVLEDGRYIVAVEPTADRARWHLTFHPLGLPSEQD